MSDPMPAIKNILGFPAEEETVIQNRDLITVARLNLARAETTDNPEQHKSLVESAQAAATVVLAEQARLHNLMVWEQISGEKNRALIREGLFS